MKKFAAILLFSVLFTSSYASAIPNKFLAGEAFDDSGRLVVRAEIHRIINPVRNNAYDLILYVTYEARHSGLIRPCQYPRTRTYANFIVGKKVIPVAMRPRCHPGIGSESVEPGEGFLRVVASDSLEFWNTLFPEVKDGQRWYALQVAFSSDYPFGQKKVSWDSNFGKNYRVIFKQKRR